MCRLSGQIKVTLGAADVVARMKVRVRVCQGQYPLVVLRGQMVHLQVVEGACVVEVDFLQLGLVGEEVRVGGRRSARE